MFDGSLFSEEKVNDLKVGDIFTEAWEHREENYIITRVTDEDVFAKVFIKEGIFGKNVHFTKKELTEANGFCDYFRWKDTDDKGKYFYCLHCGKKVYLDNIEDTNKDKNHRMVHLCSNCDKLG